MLPALLIVDDEKHTREGLQLALEEAFDVYLARDAEEAFRLLDGQEFEVVLTDLRLPGRNGLKVVEKVLSLPRAPLAVMMTAYGNVETAVEAMKRGAFDFLTKPLNLERVEALLKRAVRERRDRLDAARAARHGGGEPAPAVAPETPAATGVGRATARPTGRSGRRGPAATELIGTSPAMVQVQSLLERVAPSRASVLIEGETGTGKELVAQAVHDRSPRAGAAFMAVHCAALPASLLESELFGHEKGAFTGATERRIGRFEAADGGTLFLDEIGEIGLPVQVKLLRFLETRSFERVGSLKPIPVDVRLVAATNRNLEAMVREGTFREDLLFRLNVVRIVLPPLRERAGDLLVLLEHFLRTFAEENGVEPPVLDPSAIAILQRYPWPGNVRELRNFAENAVVLNRTGRLTEADLDPKFRAVLALGPGPGASLPPVSGVGGVEPGETGAPVLAAGSSLSVEANERRLLREALIQAKGNRTKAAQLMGISRRTLHRKLLEHPELDVK